MSSADDAAVLYLAANGWGADLTCQHLGDELDFCGKEMVGVSADDGSPLCDEHVVHPEDEGHRLTPAVIETIRVLRERYRSAHQVTMEINDEEA